LNVFFIDDVKKINAQTIASGNISEYIKKVLTIKPLVGNEQAETFS
jgi:hypothetical protein